MTDHTTNLVCVDGPAQDIRRLEDTCFDGQVGQAGRAFDFERVIPMPRMIAEGHDVADGNLGLHALGVEWESRQFSKAMQDRLIDLRMSQMREQGITSRADLLDYLRRERPQEMAAALRVIDCLKETGFPDRHEWCTAHWGARSNAARTEVRARRDGYLEFSFVTAWSPPFGVYRALSLQFPALVFNLTIIEACGGAVNGKVEDGDIVWQPCDFAAAHRTVWGHLPDDEDAA